MLVNLKLTHIIRQWCKSPQVLFEKKMLLSVNKLTDKRYTCIDILFLESDYNLLRRRWKVEMYQSESKRSDSHHPPLWGWHWQLSYKEQTSPLQWHMGKKDPEHSPQFSSSEWSPQSFCPSHLQRRGMQRWFAHRNSPEGLHVIDSANHSHCKYFRSPWARNAKAVLALVRWSEAYATLVLKLPERGMPATFTVNTPL